MYSQLIKADILLAAQSIFKRKRKRKKGKKEKEKEKTPPAKKILFQIKYLPDPTFLQMKFAPLPSISA